ncbi:MAG: peptide synthase [Opitutus sp.]|nr:peptide synthase [Opitutus sp.]
MNGADQANANIARHLRTMADRQPGGVALKIPRGRTRAGDIDYLALTFSELDQEVAAWGARLAAAGVKRGDRTLVMVRPGLPLIAAVFALFRHGAVPVVVDPGMSLKNFLVCVARSRPRALVGIPSARIISRLFRGAFRSVTVRVAAGRSLTARLTTAGAAASTSHPPEIASNAADDLAAILFTSGSTGSPKGVCYEHGMFDAQVRLIRQAYAIEPGEVDLPLLPIFALFNPALGMTTIVPEIDPRRPADVDPARIIQAIQQENVTNSFGSPTLWGKIGGHCRAHNIALPSLRRVLCAGAPVSAGLWQDSRVFLPGGLLHSPYGATEALPVATVSAAEIDPSSVRGACVGRPLPEIEVKIIVTTDAPIAVLADARELPRGEIGEIIVRGPVVTKTYDALPAATQLAKIQVTSARVQEPGPRTPALVTSPLSPVTSGAANAAPVWHRMGDCGYLDADGRIWFCGRKAERVETAAGTMHTEPCEQVFRRHGRVGRCALIGLGEAGRQRPAVVVEAKPATSADARAFARALRSLALEHPHTAGIKLFYFHPKFSVDVRHNAKIHRLNLAKWAATAKGFESDPKR